MSHLLLCEDDDTAVAAIQNQIEQGTRIISISAPKSRSFLAWAASGLSGTLLLIESLMQFAASRFYRKAPTQKWFGSWANENVYERLALRPLLKQLKHAKEGDAIYFGEIQSWLSVNVLDRWRGLLLYKLIDEHLLEGDFYLFARVSPSDLSSLPSEIRKIHRFGRSFSAEQLIKNKIELTTARQARMKILEALQKEAELKIQQGKGTRFNRRERRARYRAAHKERR